MSKVRERANPETEFANDPMMQELHKIQIKISKQIRNMDGKQLSEYFKEKTHKIRKEY